MGQVQRTFGSCHQDSRGIKLHVQLLGVAAVWAAATPNQYWLGLNEGLHFKDESPLIKVLI